MLAIAVGAAALVAPTGASVAAPLSPPSAESVAAPLSPPSANAGTDTGTDPPNNSDEPVIDVIVKPGSLRGIRPNRLGRVTVPGATFECPARAAGKCTATMKLRARRKLIGEALMIMSPGMTGAVVIQLSEEGRKLLARKRTLPADADLKIVTGSGKMARVLLRVTLKKR